MSSLRDCYSELLVCMVSVVVTTLVIFNIKSALSAISPL